MYANNGIKVSAYIQTIWPECKYAISYNILYNVLGDVKSCTLHNDKLNKG